MKVGLVLEGGAMRGLYTAGVIDTFLKEKIDFFVLIGFLIIFSSSFYFILKKQN